MAPPQRIIRPQSAPAFVDRGAGRTPLRPVFHMPPPSALHLAAAGQFDRKALALHSLPELLGLGGPPAPTAEELAAAAEAERQAEAERKAAEAEAAAAAEAEAAAASKGKAKKISAAEEAAAAEAAAAAAAEAEAKAKAEAEAKAASEAAAAAAKVNWRDRLEDRCLPYEWTPLMFAARHGTAEAVDLLVQAGASVNARDLHHATSLHKACVGAEAVAKIQSLVRAGADLEATDRYGMTPLHAAAFNERVDAVTILMNVGASQFAKDGPLLDGDTPYQMCMKNGLWDTANVLRKHEVRRKKVNAGLTRLVPADTPYCSPPAFSAKRMNPRAGHAVAGVRALPSCPAEVGRSWSWWGN